RGHVCSERRFERRRIRLQTGTVRRGSNGAAGYIRRIRTPGRHAGRTGGTGVTGLWEAEAAKKADLALEGLQGMPYDCGPSNSRSAAPMSVCCRQHRVSGTSDEARDQGGSYVRAFILILTFIAATLTGGVTAVAQEGHPLKGSWIGEW